MQSVFPVWNTDCYRLLQLELSIPVFLWAVGNSLESSLLALNQIFQVKSQIQLPTSMLSARIVEHYKLKYSVGECYRCKSPSSLSILWQIPQYTLIGASEVFMYVGQLEFFNGQAPDGLKSFGSALCMSYISLGIYVSGLLVTIVMEITKKGGNPALTTVDFVVYVGVSFGRFIKHLLNIINVKGWRATDLSGNGYLRSATPYSGGCLVVSDAS
ncbi:hypothetical protein ACLOJK_009137 [Asimina triloba]